MVVGNKFKSIDASNNNVGDYIVDTVVDINTFTVTGGVGAASGFILKHGLSSNNGISDDTDENLQARAFTIFDNEVLTITESGGISNSDVSFSSVVLRVESLKDSHLELIFKWTTRL